MRIHWEAKSLISRVIERITETHRKVTVKITRDIVRKGAENYEDWKTI